MANTQCSTVGNAFSQAVFAVLETTRGEVAKPTPVSFIAPAERCTIKQTPEFTESPELTPTLDTLKQYREANPPGTFSLGMVFRLQPAAAAPQGDDLLHATFGEVELSAGVRAYKLATCRPTFTLWVMQDHTVQFMTGCTTTEIAFPVSNSGPMMATFSGSGMRAGAVGNVVVVTTTGSTFTVAADSLNAMSVGGFVRNVTKNQTDEYQIASVNKTTNTITLDDAPVGWTSGDVIGPWLPVTSGPIGEDVVNASAEVMVNGAPGRILESTLTINLPSEYRAMVGDDFPSVNADNKRTGTIGLNTMFTKDLANRLVSTDDTQEVEIKITGSNGSGSIEWLAPRVQYQGSGLADDGPFLTLNTDGALLGVAGNDFIQLTIRS